MSLDVPTTATMRVLEKIHDLQSRSNDLVGHIQGFLHNEERLEPEQLFRLFKASAVVMKEQSSMLMKLVEAQLQLDDNLKMIVSGMEAGDGDPRET